MALLTKNKDINDFYHAYTWDKCSYDCFYHRLTRGMSRDEAILPQKLKSWPKVLTYTDENGRVCPKCLQYRERKHFSTRNAKCNYCRSKMNHPTKQQRLEWYENTRLEIWEYVMFKWWYYKVLSYVKWEWYLLKSELDWTYRRVNRNKHFNKYSRSKWLQ